MYENVDDASFRLRSTIVYYKDSYVCIEKVTKVEGSIYLKPYNFKRAIPLKDPNLIIRSIPTGYVRVGGVVLFLSRGPKRKYRQGLRADNCKVYKGDKEVPWDVFAGHILEGKKEEVKYHTIVSRDFLLVDVNVELQKIYYRRRFVGYRNKGVVSFTNGFEFMREAFEEAIGVKGE